MAFFYDEPSHTFSEYLLVPRLSGIEHIPQAVSLKTPLTKYKKCKEPKISLNIPLVSSIMQSVSDHNMAIDLHGKEVFPLSSARNQLKVKPRWQQK